ncbi:MAG: TonB-dependent receptor [bacterium]
MRRDVGTSVLLVLAAALSPAASARTPAPRDVAPRKPLVVYPKLIKFVPAVYPEEARKEGREGVVRLVVTVGADGKVTAVEVQKTAGKDLDAAAVKAVRQFLYSPATVNGQKVPAKILVAYPFKLRRDDPRPPPRRDGRPVARRPPRRPPELRPPPLRPPSPDKALTELGGRVREKGTRKLVEDAVIVVFEPGPGKAGIGKQVAQAESDAKGRFKIAKLAPGKYVVMVRVAGCYPFKVKESLTPGVRLKVDYYVERRSYDPYETVVTVKAERKQVSKYTVDLGEVQKIPGTQGDALRAVQNMPGVARASFGGGALIVRGSAPRDSRVFLESVEIPQLYHFFGLTSVFNSDILREIVFIPGNFSVAYGRATGGIIDVKTRAGKTDRWHGYVDVDIWDLGLLLEGPVGKGSIALSARRSHIDAILALMPKSVTGPSFSLAPVYYDYQAMFDYPVAKGKFKLLFFGSDDRIKLLLNEPNDFDPSARQISTTTLFHRVLSYWQRKWDDNELKLILSGGYFENEFFLSESLRLKLQVARINWRAHYTRKFHKTLSIQFGLVGESTTAWVDFSAPPLPREGEIPQPLSAQEVQSSRLKGQLVSQALFVEATWKPNDWLTLIPGLRLDYLHIGPLDGVTFDPRLTTKFKLHKKLSLNLGIGLFHQEPFYTELFPVSGGNPNTKHERSLHASLGLAWQARQSLSMEMTGFVKYLWRRIAGTSMLVWRDGEVVRENVANQGKGRIFGGEILIKKKPDRDCPKWLKLQKCFGWISYTILRSERQDEPGGNWRLFDFDQTHILTIVLSGAWPGGWELGIRFRLASGNPTTFYQGGIYDADGDNYLGLPGQQNAERLPLFHQLDIRLDKKFVFKKWMLSIYLDIQNVYNYQASEFVVYNFNYTEKSYLKGLPIIPSIGVKGAF